MGTQSGAGLLRPEAGMGLAPLPAARLVGVPQESNVIEPILQRQSSPLPPPVSYQSILEAFPGLLPWRLGHFSSLDKNR